MVKWLMFVIEFLQASTTSSWITDMWINVEHLFGSFDRMSMLTITGVSVELDTLGKNKKGGDQVS
jgi:hypothetical protein